jgi:predicted nuclease of predicted toxin-antitoxin system
VKVLVDMNLPAAWVRRLAQDGIESAHWSAVGDPRAPDAELMSFARTHGYVVFTHDLDFGITLALTRAVGPSVVQVRTQDVTPETLGSVVVRLLRTQAEALERGALITLDEAAARVRILPIA